VFRSPTHPRQALALLAVCLGTFMLTIDVTIVIVALPSIHTALRTSLSDEQWTIDAYSLSLAALLLPAGSLADILGRRGFSPPGWPCSPSARCCAASPALAWKSSCSVRCRASAAPSSSPPR
jgi:MFS family permease